MIMTCHRCGGDLSHEPESRFCLYCGAPQLWLSSLVLGTPESAGAPPPPRPALIDWRAAITACLLVAGVMALLLLAAARLPALSIVWLLWTGSGALIALHIYQSLRRGARMSARIGARIGASLGVLMAAALTLALAVTGAVTRFYLHGMGNFDQELRTRMTEQIRAAVATNPAAGELAQQQIMPGLIAGSLLLGLGIACVFLFLVSVLGGALGGLLRERRSVES